MKKYIFLSLSIIGEVFATAMLKESYGFTILIPSLLVLIGYGLSFYCLSLTLKEMPLSIAYAIWSGVGTITTALIGIIFWGEIISFLKFLALFLIISGVILLTVPDRYFISKLTD